MCALVSYNGGLDINLTWSLITVQQHLQIVYYPCIVHITYMSTPLCCIFPILGEDDPSVTPPSLGDFHCLLILRVLRPDRFHIAMGTYVHQQLLQNNLGPCDITFDQILKAVGGSLQAFLVTQSPSPGSRFGDPQGVSGQTGARTCLDCIERLSKVCCTPVRTVVPVDIGRLSQCNCAPSNQRPPL